MTEPASGRPARPGGPGPAPRAIAFDVNETLLDLGALDGYFEETFGDASARREWFAALLQTAMVTTITGDYHSFSDLGAACLDALGHRLGRRVGVAERERLAWEMARLPAHPDVPAALSALRDHGYRLAALTNNTLDVVRLQMENAGLTPMFHEVLSADEVRRLKPAPEPYRHAAERLGTGIGELLLAAAHGWDCAGARAAGARAAFVARPGQHPLPAGPAPDLVVAGLADLAATLTAGGGPGSAEPG